MSGRKIVSLPSALEEAVEDYRFANRFKTESDALRHLIELGLAAAKAQLSALDLAVQADLRAKKP